MRVVEVYSRWFDRVSFGSFRCVVFLGLVIVWFKIEVSF